MSNSPEVFRLKNYLILYEIGKSMFGMSEDEVKDEAKDNQAIDFSIRLTDLCFTLSEKYDEEKEVISMEILRFIVLGHENLAFVGIDLKPFNNPLLTSELNAVKRYKDLIAYTV